MADDTTIAATTAVEVEHLLDELGGVETFEPSAELCARAGVTGPGLRPRSAPTSGNGSANWPDPNRSSGRGPTKTRSGKIMRRLLRDIAEGRELGDITTLGDPTILHKLQEKATARATTPSYTHIPYTPIRTDDRNSRWPPRVKRSPPPRSRWSRRPWSRRCRSTACAVSTSTFDPALPHRCSPSVALPPEAFGALVYHFGTWRLSFLKTPQLVGVVSGLAHHPDVHAAVEAAGVEEAQRPAYLRALAWELTYACNLPSVHCLSSSGRGDPRELTTAEAKGVIDELMAMQVFYVNIGGGEPTVRPDFWDLLDYAIDHNSVPAFSRPARARPGCYRRW